MHGVLHFVEGFADDNESPTKHSPPFSIANNFLPACLAMLAQKAGLISEAEYVHDEFRTRGTPSPTHPRYTGVEVGVGTADVDVAGAVCEGVVPDDL